MYTDAARSLSESGRCRVILCARPEEIRERDDQRGPGPGDGEDSQAGDRDGQETGGDFHDLLKAQALGLACPLQIMRRETWEGATKGSSHPRRSRTRPPGRGTCTPRCTTRPAARPGGCPGTAPTCHLLRRCQLLPHT